MTKIFLSLLWAAMLAPVGVSAAIPYPAPPGALPSTAFSMSVNGRPVFVEAFKDVAYAGFTAGEADEVTITLPAGLATEGIRLLPASAAPRFTAAGGTLRFTVTKPARLALEMPGQPRLFLFADAPEKDEPTTGAPGVIEATAAGADRSGQTLSTAPLQRALDSLASRSEGGTLLLSPGLYRTGTLVIRGRTRLHLAAGARLEGTSDPADYPLDPGLTEKGTNGFAMTFSRLILIDKADGASITGRGSISGGGSVLRRAGRAANLVRVRSSRNVRITGVTLRDPAAWNLHVLDCDGVIIDDIRILNDRRVANTDGIDPDSSKHVRIERVFAYCGDDNIAIKSSGNSGLLRDTEDILIRDCTFYTLKSSLKVGTETRATRMTNIRFENIDVLEADRALALYCSDGAAFSNIVFDDIRVNRIGIDSRASTEKRLMQFRINKRVAPGSIENVRISRLQLDAPAPKPSEFRGLDATHVIRNITFSGITIAGKPVTRITDLPIETNEFVMDLRVESNHSAQ